MNKSLFLLLMLHVCDGRPIRGKTRFVKLMYIAGKKLQKLRVHVGFYKFYRYYYGPYANELITDLENLIERNLVDHVVREKMISYGVYEENCYRITNEGRIALETKSVEVPSLRKISDIFIEVKEKYNGIPLSMLIQEVHKKYPLSAK